MELRVINEGFADLSRFYEIYEEAFPECERIPTSEFLDVICDYGCTPWAIYHEERLVGFTCVMHRDSYRIGYIWFFAIAAEYRGQGMGSKALQLLREEYSDSQLVLDMENLDPEAANYSQRISRLRFYERNGFKRAFISMHYLGMDFELMSNPAPFHFDDFRSMIEEASNGRFNPTYSPMPSRTILFLHGFFASGQCIPATALKQALRGEATVVAPDLPLHPSEALSMIRQLCDTIRPEVIVGNSCGAFYAQQIACEKAIPALLGNPYFEMSQFLLSRLGTHQYKSPRKDGRQQFTIDEALIAEFSAIEATQFDLCSEAMKDRIWGLFGTADTLAHFEPLFLKHYIRAFHFPGGHTPTAEEAKDYYAPLIRKMLLTYSSNKEIVL